MQLSTTADATADTYDLRTLMEEPAGGHNHGRAAVDPYLNGTRLLELGVEDAQERDLLAAGGWTIFSRKDGRRAGIAPAAQSAPEYMDETVLRDAVEAALGFTYDEVRSVYRQGRLSPEQGELRARIDARLLALSRAGGEVHELGRRIGLGMARGGGGGAFCPAIRNALIRARAASC